MAQARGVLSFPNRSRFYDEAHRVVRFWGHDSAMEAPFFIDEEALRKLEPAMISNEAGLLGAFDAHVEKIHSAAARVYGRGRKGSYDLQSSDL